MEHTSGDINNSANDDAQAAFERSLKAVAQRWGVAVFPLGIEKIEPRESIRLKCLVPLCEYYEVCKVCPPHIPSVSEFREALRDYRQAFLVVLKERIDSINRYREDFGAELKLASAVAELELTAFQHGHYQAIGLCVGGCKLCPQCAPSGEPCRHPFKARPSPEGFGIDITALAREVGVAVEWPPKEAVIFMGLVLV